MIINEFRMVVDSRSVNESFSRATVSAFAAQLDPTVEEINDIKTAVSEAVTNCIVHGYRNSVGKIYIGVKIHDDNRVIITIRDRGCGISEPFYPIGWNKPETKNKNNILYLYI